MTTEVIHPVRVWPDETKDGKPRFDLIGKRTVTAFATWRCSTFDPLSASLWDQTAKAHGSLRVTWQSAGHDGRYRNLVSLDVNEVPA